MAEAIQTLGELCATAARQWPDRTCLVFDQLDESLTFREFDQRSNAVANALIGVGVAPGDRVAVMLRNVPEFPLTWLGIVKAGAIMVSVNAFYKSADAGYVLDHSGAKVLIASRENLPVIDLVKSDLASLETVVLTQDMDDGCLSLPDLTASVDATSPRVPVFPEMLANIQYTSGTTGRPKGCMLSHYMWSLSAGALMTGEAPGAESRVILTAQPYYYIDPSFALVSALADGATLVVLDRFHPSTLWSKIREYRVTQFYCLGAMPALLLKTPACATDTDHRLPCVMCSGIPPGLHAALEERFGVPWYEVYGMTEIAGGTREDPDEHDEVRGTGCIGRASPNREIRVVGENGRPLSRGKVGELIVRGPGMMDGYYRDPDATAAVFKDGWFHTGDLVRMDPLGRVYFVGRIKDMIRRSGENISAAEVEEVITSNPAVQIAACLPVPDELRGEEVKAYVAVSDVRDRDQMVQALTVYCEERLAYFKVPRYWALRADLPRTPSERVAKGELKAETADLRVDAYDRVDGVWR